MDDLDRDLSDLSVDDLDRDLSDLSVRRLKVSEACLSTAEGAPQFYQTLAHEL